MSLDSIRGAFMIEFRLAHGEPTNDQMRQIVATCPPGSTDAEIIDAVKRYCPSFGTRIYAGEGIHDLQDAVERLRRLLGQ